MPSWPLARFVTFTANVTKIAATALNAFQDGTVGLYQGTGSGGLTVKSLEADGVGAAAKTASDGEVVGASLRATTNGVTATLGDIVATAGKLLLGATRGSATYGAGQGVPLGTMYGDGMDIAWGNVASNAAAVWGYNVSSSTHTGTGVYTIVLVNGAGSAAKLGVAVTIQGATLAKPQVRVVNTNGTTFVVDLFDDGTPADSAFTFVCKGSP